MSGNRENNREDIDECECERFEMEKPQAEEATKTAAQCGHSTRGVDLKTIAELADSSEGTEVAFYATIHTLRSVSPTLEILQFRDGTDSIQGVLSRTAQPLTKSPLLSPRSFVQVVGTLQKPLGSVRSSGPEVRVDSIFPLDEIYDAPELAPGHMLMRILDLRLPFNQALFRMRALVLRTFRQVLEDREFIEIQTPKLQQAGTEVSAEAFEVDHYGRQASLAQSSQLAHQLAIEGGFERVYEVGPVFATEVSKFQDNFAESISVDVGMTFGRSYYDLIQVVDSMLKSVFAVEQGIPELRIVRERWPSKDIAWLDETPIISVTEALHMLQIEGLSNPKEQTALRDNLRLGALVKERFMTDYFILDEISAKKPSSYFEKAEGYQWTDLFSVFLRGKKICTGGKWIHETEEFWYTVEQAQTTENDGENHRSGLDTRTLSYGSASISLEHFLEVFLELRDITYASLFPSRSR